MKIRKISASSDGTMVIDYDNPNPNRSGEIDVMSLKTKDIPRPEFKTALDNLQPHLLTILELPTGYGKNMRISGISLSVKGDVTSANIKAVKTLQNSNSAFNIVTPKKPMSCGEEASGADLLTDECISAIEELVSEAKLFIKGERLQSELRLEDTDDEDEEPEEIEEEEEFEN